MNLTPSRRASARPLAASQGFKLNLKPFFSTLASIASKTFGQRGNSRPRNQVPTELESAQIAYALARRELIAAEKAGDTRRIGAAFKVVKATRTEWMRLACENTGPTDEFPNCRKVVRI